MKEETQIKVLFAHDKKQVSYSETFVHNQFEQLPFDFEYLFVSNESSILYNQKTIQDQSGFWSLGNRVKRKFAKKSLSDSLYEDNLGFIKTLNPKAILAQYGTIGSHMVRYALALNIPLIVHFHGYDSGRKDILKRFNNYKELFAESTAIVAVSKTMKNKLESLGAQPDKVNHICYGIDYNLFKVKESYQNQQIICVGRFTDKKAPQITLYAFSKVLKENNQAKLAMIGDGPLYDACKKLAKAMGISSSVKFLGVLSSLEIAVHMQESLIFAQHSLTPESGDTEGTPLAILEAMSSGLPVVSTRHAGIQDVVEENESGFLIDEGDADAMADSMLKLLADFDLCAKFGKKGREIVEGNYGLSRYMNDLTTLIQNNLK